MRDTAILAFMLGQPWAMHPPIMRAAEAILVRRMDGWREDAGTVAAIVSDRDRRQSVRSSAWSAQTDADEERGYFYDGNVAVVPVSGVLSKYADMINGMSQPSGMTSDQVVDAVQRAGSDRRATAGVLLDIDSPGGTVAGVNDMVRAVEDVRASGRPVVALSHDMAASAAYWLAAAADEVFTVPTGEVGSIGVYTVAEDSSAYFENKGFKRTLIASGPHKGAGADGTRLTADHVAAIGENVDALASAFRSYVAERRGLSPDRISAASTGRVFVGADAVAAGLADGVAHYSDITAAMNRRDKEGKQ